MELWTKCGVNVVFDLGMVLISGVCSIARALRKTQRALQIAAYSQGALTQPEIWRISCVIPMA
jgi:hypothetical protein